MGRRILIVDGEMFAARELAAMLMRCGHDVAGVASSGRRAIALAASVAPELALVDSALPGDVDGAEVAEEMRRRSIPVILMTAGAESAPLRAACIAEPLCAIAKPVLEQELHVAIHLAFCRRVTERQLHDLDERFFAISLDMLCFLDFDGHFKRLNPAWERTLGFTREELMSRPFIEFVHPDDREPTLRQNAEVRAGGQALGFENRYRRRDGSYRWFRWNATPGAAERVIYSVARDVTTQRAAETARDHLLRRLQAARGESPALGELGAERGIMPICSHCRKVRDGENHWQSIESYFLQHTHTHFSHGVCPSCYAKEVERLLSPVGS
ncbi:MAG TPA: PAS domain S-box protein [Gemmatimonadaceae bacterium]|nr:PAS domain S-box protein [Gemmatimonadaceae bacterium]